MPFLGEGSGQRLKPGYHFIFQSNGARESVSLQCTKGIVSYVSYFKVIAGNQWSFFMDFIFFSRNAGE